MNILSKKAVLASLNVGGWNARKRDDKASEVVHKHYKADKDSGNYNKCLIDVKDEDWKRIIAARSDLRDYHYKMTVGWVNKGAQLLASAMYLEYNSGTSKRIKAYLGAAERFIDRKYEALKAEAKKKRNGLYRESEYPTAGELRRKFYAEVVFLPVPDSGHVIVDLQNKEVARIKADTEAMVDQAVQQATAELWHRLYAPVKHMAEALVDPKQRFHDTLISNVQDIVRIAEPMNLAGDANLTAMVEEVKKHLTKAKPDTLREDMTKRAENARKASELAKKMRTLMPVAP